MKNPFPLTTKVLKGITPKQWAEIIIEGFVQSIIFFLVLKFLF